MTPRHVWQVAHELPDTNDTVLFNEAGSELLVLNNVAAAIWYLIDGRRSIADITEFIRDELPSTPVDAEEAVRSFVDDMLTRGALEVVEDAD